VDLDTRAASNLTDTPNRAESCPIFWREHNLLIFGSRPAGEGPVPYGLGVPTIMTMNGGNYTVLPYDAEMALADLSPRGDILALLGGELLLTPSNFQSLPSTSDDTGLPYDLALSVPSWSPDGTRLAWSAWAVSQPEDSITVVYEIPTLQLTTIHPYVIEMGEGFPPSPFWSADSNWLSLRTYDPSPALPGLWVFSADGSVEHRIGSAESSIWSPDAPSMIATIHGSADAPAEPYLFTAPIWQPRPVDIPQGAWLIAWLSTEAAGKLTPEG
jgi:hypothetical protein